MKRLFTLSVICLAAVSLIGCSDYKQQARVWVCEKTDHFVSTYGEPTLYYFEDYALFGGPLFTKVNLKDKTTSLIKSITCKKSCCTYRFIDLEDFGLPTDKGYGKSSAFVVVVEDSEYPIGKRQAAFLFDAYKGEHLKLCDGDYVKVHDYALVSSAHRTHGSFSSVDVYDVEGNKLETKTYTGTIAGQNVMAEIVQKDGAIAGSYYYTKYGPGKHRIWIYGEIDEEGEFDIEGYNADKYNCEDWRGTIKNGSIHGKVYINFNNRNYDFTLTEVVK